MQSVPGRPIARLAYVPIVWITTGAFVLALEISYRDIISPAFTYQKLTYTPPTATIYLALLGEIAILGVLLPRRLAKPADFVLWILYGVVVIPSVTVSYYARTLTPGMQLQTATILSVCFAGIILATRGTPFGQLDRRLPKLTPALFSVAIGLFSIVTYGLLFTVQAPTLTLPSFDEVSSVRSTYKEFVANVGLLGYLVPTQGYVINPLLMVLGLRRGRRWLIALGVLGELVLFSAAAFRAILLAPIAVFLVVLMFRKRNPRGYAVILGTTAVVAVSAILDSQFGGVAWSSLFTRRFLHTPGVLTGAWVNVWEPLTKAHFGYSFLSPFTSYPYADRPPYIVGATYFNSPSLNANANLFADGYANWGWAGMIFESAVLALLLTLINSLFSGIPMRQCAAVLAMPTVALSNSSVFTSITTHGLFVATALLGLAPRTLFALDAPDRTPRGRGQSLTRRSAGKSSRATLPSSRS